MSAQDAVHAFLPWLRRGVSGAITRVDGEPATAARVVLPVAVSFNAGTVIGTADLELAGPGEVVGLDPRAVVRTWPRPGVVDAETNFFPLVELEPDLPWRYTPARASAKDRLRPWLCLAVLAESELARYEPALSGRPLPAVTVRDASVLPNLDQCWAWTHVQVSGVESIDTAGAAELLKAGSPRLVSRLLCPRRLQPETSYRAVLVPTFERGRLAGLGDTVPAGLDGLVPAWSPDGVAVRLPVYFEWSFHTGTAADFEYLVRLLVARELPATVGIRPLDVAEPGAGLPPAATGPLALEGALRAPTTETTPWPASARDPWTAELAALLNRPEELLDAGTGDRALAPPLYGRWHAGQSRLDPDAEPPWFQELNGDPRLRVTAGLGTLVVQDQQQQLLAGAWRQVDGVVALNDELRWAQLAREAATRIHQRHVAAADPEATLATTAPLHRRVARGNVTLEAQLRQSPVVDGALDAAFRRVARPLGPIGRRQGRASAPSQRGLLKRMNRGELTVAAPPALDARHAATADAAGVGVERLRPDLIVNLVRRPDFVAREGLPVRELGQPPVRPADPLGRPDSASTASFRRECARMLGRLTGTPDAAPALRPVGLDGAAADVLDALEPRATIGDAYRRRLQTAPGVPWDPADPLEPVLAAPEFPQPMAEALAAVSPEGLLPGLDQVPPNTVSVLETNQRFVEAYMVGLNHELSRELLWNEYPTDLRGTYFRCFWDPSGDLAADPPKDIEQIHTWPADAQLGANSGRPQQPADAPPQLVLLIRGELLRRYPTALVYATRATIGTDGLRTLDESVPERHPIFTGTLPPDVAYFGFELTEEQARGGAPPDEQGWFFVIQEQPAEPRFGLDLAPVPDPDPPTDWDDLAWEHLGPDVSYVDLDAELPDTREVADPGGPGAAWHADAGLGPAGTRASHLAYITLQRPVRVAIHASQMLPPTETPA